MWLMMNNLFKILAVIVSPWNPRDRECSPEPCEAKNEAVRYRPAANHNATQFIHRAPISHCWVAFHRSETFTSLNAWGGRIVFHVYSKEFTWEPTKNQKPQIQRTCIPVWYRLKDSGFTIQVDAWIDESWRCKKRKERLSGCWFQWQLKGNLLPSYSFGNCTSDTLGSRNQSDLFEVYSTEKPHKLDINC